MSVSQSAHTERERLNRTRAAIFKQQNELEAKLKEIDSEMHAIDATKLPRRAKHRLGDVIAAGYSHSTAASRSGQQLMARSILFQLNPGFGNIVSDY